MAGAPRRALLYLARAQAANRWRWRLRRLRQPRYLLGALAALAYFGWIAWSTAGDGDAGRRPATVVTWALPLVVAVHWLGRPNPLALAFAQAEVHFLFPAPIPRRTLIHARLLGQQAATFGAVLVWLLLFDPARDPAAALVRAVGVWCVVTAFALHRTGAALARIELPDTPRPRPIARMVAIAWLCAVLGTMLTGWSNLGPLEIGDGSPITVVLERLRATLATPALHLVLTPVRWVAAPATAPSAADALRALPLAFAVVAALYAWVVADPRPFEEAAADATRRLADRLAAARRGTRTPTADAAPARRRRAAALPLPRRGPAALAFVWKSILATSRAYAPRAIALAALALAAAAIALPSLTPDPADGRALRTALLAAVATAALVTLPSWFRQDLRTELGHLVFLKTAPISSRDIIAAQTGAASLMGAAVMLLLFAAPTLVVIAADPLLGFATSIALAAEALLVALPVVVLLLVTVHNAIALLFPGWSRIGQAGVGGLQAMGQAYLSLAAILAALAVLLAAPAAVGWLVTAALPGAAGIALALPAAAAVAIGEWWLACTVLARQLDRLEPDALPPSAG